MITLERSGGECTGLCERLSSQSGRHLVGDGVRAVGEGVTVQQPLRGPGASDRRWRNKRMPKRGAQKSLIESTVAASAVYVRTSVPLVRRLLPGELTAPSCQPFAPHPRSLTGGWCFHAPGYGCTAARIVARRLHRAVTVPSPPPPRPPAAPKLLIPSRRERHGEQARGLPHRAQRVHTAPVPVRPPRRRRLVAVAARSARSHHRRTRCRGRVGERGRGGGGGGDVGSGGGCTVGRQGRRGGRQIRLREGRSYPAEASRPTRSTWDREE